MNRRQFVSGLVGTAAIASAALPIKRVLVIFKCHFDAGFVDTQAAVVHKYFTQYFPQAIEIAQQSAGKYVWTTGSWLLYRYLEQANTADRRRMEAAVEQGLIAWHALPFTWQTELLDRSTIEGCLGFSKVLDRRFGRTTTGAKMSDVPGHSRGLIAPLSEAGVSFLDIGVNGASTPPDVPAIFRWQDPNGASLTVMYHRTAYGGIVEVPGSDLAIDVEVRDDNSGPHTADEIRKIYADLHQRFPNAHIQAANLTQIADAVKPYGQHLPVVTQEIGDTWIYGVPSDPVKVARFRELQRLRSEWLAAGKFGIADATDLAFLSHYALGAEHTWGTDTKTWLDFDHYTPRDLQNMLNTPKYRTVTGSWVEKRADLDAAVATLPAALKAEANRRLAILTPRQADITNLQHHDAATVFEKPHFTVALDPGTGAITTFRAKASNRDWASTQNPLAAFHYQTLSKQDYDRFLHDYITVETWWAPKDFGKPNIERLGAQHSTWNTKLVGAFWSESKQEHRLVARLRVDAPHQLPTTAWPEEMSLTLSLPTDEPVAHITYSWFHKPANRLPEALWLNFHPIAPDPSGWTLDKVGQRVSPFDVVPGGNRHMHALGKGVTYRDANGELTIETMDAPVIAFNQSPIGYSKENPNLSTGIHFSLFNNGWGTNYVQWFGEDVQFRFALRT